MKENILGGPGHTDSIQTGVLESNVVITNTKVDADGPANPISGIEQATSYGTAGADTLDASGFGGEVQFYGRAGDDDLRGGSGDDALEGDGGSDTYAGNGGDDRLDDVYDDAGPEGDDTFNGGPGHDTASDEGPGDMTVTANQVQGAGTNNLIAVEEVGVFTTGTASDIDGSAFAGFTRLIASGTGSNTLIGGQGGSVMRGDLGADVFTGNSTDDEAWLFDLPTPTFVTDAGMTSAQGNDTFSGIDSLNMSDTSGASLITTSGFTGDVSFFSHGGPDIVTTGSGDDFVGIYGGSASLGGGSDTVYQSYVTGDQTLTDSQSSVGPTNLTSVEHYEISRFEGLGTFDASAWTGTTDLEGDEAEQTLIGGSGVDIFRGGEGSDSLEGMGGNDRLLGGNGGDDIDGGPNKDFCDGGNGGDTFTSCETQKN